jgi:hypothetical protein
LWGPLDLDGRTAKGSSPVIVRPDAMPARFKDNWRSSEQQMEGLRGFTRRAGQPTFFMASHFPMQITESLSAQKAPCDIQFSLGRFLY